MSDFLLELRSEEIPARMQQEARLALEKLFQEQMAAAGIENSSVEVWSTPRRLALIATGLPDKTPAVHTEIKGPRVSAPDKALEGFLRKTGLQKDQLTERDGIWFAVDKADGRPMAEILAHAVPEICRNFPWRKSMRWGERSISTQSVRWVRPLSGIVAIFAGDVVECEVGGVRSGRKTRGHRFHHPDEITIDGPHDYHDKLYAAHVIVDHAKRESLIRDGAREVAGKAGLALVEDKGLVIENAGLTEWPVPLLGRFSSDFLDVPHEVIQLTARNNQKYFVCTNHGKLANAFICTANLEATDGGEAIIVGNAKVIAARLSDARFFWDQDRRKTLSEHVDGLSRITFHAKLGTLADKAERVAKLACWFVENGVISGADITLVRQAALLAKADLVTEMVGEFPELQGVIGGYYARAEDLPEPVANAIAEHYKPAGMSDSVPDAPVSVAVALADKLDTLCRFFVIGEYPTGSKDPFALRRAGLGIIALILHNDLRIRLRTMIEAAIGKENTQLHLDRLTAFLCDRLKVQQKAAGVRHDLIDAVFSVDGDIDFVRLLARVKALQSLIGTADGANLLAAYKRAANILRKEAFTAAEDGFYTGEMIFEGYEPDPAEQHLAKALGAVTRQVDNALEEEDFTSAMTALATLRGPIDTFFESVTVNDPVPEKRRARLALLDRFRAAVHRVADFSKIEG